MSNVRSKVKLNTGMHESSNSRACEYLKKLFNGIEESVLKMDGTDQQDRSESNHFYRYSCGEKEETKRIDWKYSKYLNIFFTNSVDATEQQKITYTTIQVCNGNGGRLRFGNAKIVQFSPHRAKFFRKIHL